MTDKKELNAADTEKVSGGVTINWETVLDGPNSPSPKDFPEIPQEVLDSIAKNKDANQGAK